MKRFISVVVLAVLFGSTTLVASAHHGDKVSGSATHMGSYPVPLHYAATHHGDNQPTFKDGSVLLLSRGRKTFWVKVTDVCAGSSCHMLDLNPAAFVALGASPSSGVMKVDVRCGKAGHKPIRKCLAGEDK